MDLLTPQNPQPVRKVLTVSRLNREVRGLLEGNFPLMWIEGEISNFAAPGSGHWYFSLKDNKAQVRCAMFKNRNQLVRYRPKNGEQVLLRARISVYEPRGEYQLLIEHMEAAGQGDLQRRFEELKAKLEKEGLFDPVNKQDLPDLSYGGVKRVGIITSPTGAAVRDVLSVLKRRYPMTEAQIYPVLVQGEQAAQDVAQAIKLANQRKDCDILLVVRGGGSIEDLWAFNEEVVARAIAASELPIISGVGHETDFTIADFVADRRAPTPSVAAEMVTPDARELLSQVNTLQQNLVDELEYRLEQDKTRLTYLQRRLQQQHPRQQLQQQAQRLGEINLRLQKTTRYSLSAFQHRFERSQQSLLSQRPDIQLSQRRQRLQHQQQRLQAAVHKKLNHAGQQLALASRELNTISPLQTLERGYAIALHNGKAIKNPQDVKQGDKLDIKLAQGEVSATVD